MANFDRQLAEFIRGKLEDATFPETVDVARNYKPKREAAELQTPVLTVAHGYQQRTPASRSQMRCEHMIRVGIEALVQQEDGQFPDDRGDELSDLTEAVIDTIESDCGTYEGATLTEITTEPFYDVEAMDNPGIWRGVLTLTYTRTRRS